MEKIAQFHLILQVNRLACHINMYMERKNSSRRQEKLGHLPFVWRFFGSEIIDYSLSILAKTKNPGPDKTA